MNGNSERVRRASGAGSAVGLGVGSAVHCSGVTSDNGPVVNGPAMTSRNCVLVPVRTKH